MFNTEDEEFHKEFALRITHLRRSNGVSARDMSLSLGFNPSYINAIENNRAMPSMQTFFEICNYLSVTPKEFFDIDAEEPEEQKLLFEKIKKLDKKQRELVGEFIGYIADIK